MEGKPQLHCMEPWVPRGGRLWDAQAVRGGDWHHCPGKPGPTPALASPGGHLSFSQPQGKTHPWVAFSPPEQCSQGTACGAGWLFVLSRVGDAVTDVERGCKMG